MTDSELSPPEKVVAAMPGTLPELSAATGYSPGVVLKQITRARVDGHRVNAVRDVSISTGSVLAPEVDALTTVYEVVK